MKRTHLFLLIAIISLVMSVRAKPGAPSNKTVTLTNFQFTPRQLSVKDGTTITWLNKEGTHTVTADDGSWESGTLRPGDKFSHQFNKPGTYGYHCSFHGSAGGGNMAGSLSVVR